MRSVELEDVVLNVVDVGDGPTLLLVHGFPLDHSMWQHQITRFGGEYRVIAPDLRGFGRSSCTCEKATMQQFADDLAQLLDALRMVQPIAFCGLSMGGYIAWQFWRRHRQRLGRLILCDTRALPDTAEAAHGRLEAAQRVLADGPAHLVDTMLPKLFAEETLREQPELTTATRQVMLGTAAAAIAAALRGMAERPDMTRTLPEMDVPALVLCGTHDAIARLEEMRDIAAAMPRARFVEIPHAGHMAPLENPAAANAAIRDFLAST